MRQSRKERRKEAVMNERTSFTLTLSYYRSVMGSDPKQISYSKNRQAVGIACFLVFRRHSARSHTSPQVLVITRYFHTCLAWFTVRPLSLVLWIRQRTGQVTYWMVFPLTRPILLTTCRSSSSSAWSSFCLCLAGQEVGYT